MKTQLMGLALAATTIGVLTACSAPGNQKLVSEDAGRPAAPHTSTTTHAATTSRSTAAKKKNSAKIVYFKLVQKPRCPEGTAVFRAKSVPAIIKWKITGATGAALSVDDKTHTPGTYGPEPLSGTETFMFSCQGPVSSTEKHTYTIYTVGGGKQHHLTLTAKAKVIDDGIH